ncbi:MAG: M48 family metalloprotease [Deltaproteobacteria bacterium]|nr:M48 family metalloprotease [Deltaproteobacteria bacterium]
MLDVHLLKCRSLPTIPMFNNIIYFIVVLLIFNINYPEKAPESSLVFSIIMLALGWLVFGGYCGKVFQALLKRLDQGEGSDGRMTSQYQRLVLRLSVLAILLFAMDVYFLNLKYWLQMVPGLERFSVLQGALALALFLFYLGTMWYFAYPVYEAIFRPGITRRSFVRSHVRFNLPILFPWFILTLLHDLLALSPWSGPKGILSGVGGQVIFFSSFLTLLMIIMPWFIQHWWGCKPLSPSEKGGQLEGFLHDKGFKYRRLLKWPIFEGRLMTAGIMGIVPRYRYILITDALLEMLSLEELKAVMCHEMGHAKYRHLLYYLFFFVGFMVLSFGMFDLFPYLLYAHPFFAKSLSDAGAHAGNLFYLFLSIPMLMTLVVYFRYVMGFFMRHFERQADLYSAEVMGTPEHTISSLEKIALLSGKSRDLPSWHHFSIKERVDYLWRALRNPGLIKRHHRFVTASFLIYLITMAGLGYVLNFSPVKQDMAFTIIEKGLHARLLKEPENAALYQDLAVVYHTMGKYQEAKETYEKIIDLDPNQAASLNNLAWLLVTASREELRDERRGLDLAKRAVALERSPAFLDTLAEAYYVNGFVQDAIHTTEEAITRATGNRAYYKKQLKKFLASKP